MSDIYDGSAFTSEAKERWGNTAAWREFENKRAGSPPEQLRNDAEGLMQFFAKIGRLKHLSPQDALVQDTVGALQKYISDHYFTCTDELFAGLGKLYSGDPRFVKNIDRVGGEGTAAFVGEAIAARSVDCRS